MEGTTDERDALLLCQTISGFTGRENQVPLPRYVSSLSASGGLRAHVHRKIQGNRWVDHFHSGFLLFFQVHFYVLEAKKLLADAEKIIGDAAHPHLKSAKHMREIDGKIVFAAEDVEMSTSTSF